MYTSSYYTWCIQRGLYFDKVFSLFRFDYDCTHVFSSIGEISVCIVENARLIELMSKKSCAGWLMPSEAFLYL